MPERSWSGLVWLLAGMAIMAVIVWFAMPSMMLIDSVSAHGYQETIKRLDGALASRGDWKVLAVNDYQQATAAFVQIEPTGSVNVCNPRYASRILATENDRGVTALMPLALGVHEDAAGRVHVTRLNVGLLGMMFGGTIADVMGDAGDDLKQAVAEVSAPAS